MRIDELTIINFKCFENETFRFNPHFNVVIGKNASGKSSLLDALAIAASSYLSGIDEQFIRRAEPNETRTIVIEGQPKPQLPVVIKAKGYLHEKSIEWVPEINKEPPFRHPTAAIRSGGRPIEDYGKFDLMSSRKNSEQIIFPLIAYYGTGRLLKKQGAVEYFKQGEGVFAAYPDCLNPKTSSDIFLSWYKSYEATLHNFKQQEYILFLKLFQDTISSIVPEWTDMAYNFIEDDLIGTFKDKGGVPNRLPFSNLSDGYRNMIGMVADMVYRCIQLNPGLKENVLTETDGIVLIDELDLHLHPEWQRRIVGDLKRIFPKVQFVVTTHSPFIIQSLKQEELIVLEKNFIEDKDPWRKSVEEISEDEMQVPDIPRSHRFKEMVDTAKEYFTLVRQNDNNDILRTKINDAKQNLDKLRILYSDDPAYVAILTAELEKTENNAAHN